LPFSSLAATAGDHTVSPYPSPLIIWIKFFSKYNHTPKSRIFSKSTKVPSKKQIQKKNKGFLQKIVSEKFVLFCKKRKVFCRKRHGWQ
jgi:hypothetical protein